MARQGKLKSIAGKILEEEIKADAFNEEEYDPSRRNKPFLEQAQDQETKAMDQLLLSIPRSQGYYLKLEKELRPGLWEYKDRYDDWMNWTDLQYQMASIVRGYTAKPGLAAKWGSGLYRFLVWRDGGLRETDKYPPIIYPIDAMESISAAQSQQIIQSSINPAETLQSQISMLSQVLDLVKKGNPTPDDTKQVYEKLADLKVDLAKNESTNQTNVMTSMINMLQTQMNRPPEQRQSAIQELAALFVALAPTGVFDKLLKPSAPISSPSPSNPMRELVDALQQVKTLGLIPEPKKELSFSEQLEQLQRLNQIINPPKLEKDSIEQTVDFITKTKNLMNVLEPGKDTTSPWLRFAESFAPHIVKIGSEAIDYLKSRKTNPVAQQPIIIADPNQAVRNVQIRSMPAEQPINDAGGMFTAEDMAQMRRAEEYRNRTMQNNQGQPGQTAPIDQPQQVQQVQQSQQPIIIQEEQMLPVFIEMKQARDMNSIEYYPILRDLLIVQLGDNYDSLLSGQLPVDYVLTQGRPYAGTWIIEQKTRNYFISFINWANTEKKNEFIAYCDKCEEEIVFSNKTLFNQSAKTCETCGSPLSIDEEPINISSSEHVASEPQQHQQIDQLPEILSKQ
jgi:hypothetical protein